MKVIILSYRSNLSIAKETAQANIPQMMLNQACIVIGSPKEIFSPAVTAAKATTVYRDISKGLSSPVE